MDKWSTRERRSSTVPPIPTCAIVPLPVAFIGGLIFSPALYALFSGVPDATIQAGYPVLVLAGLLVGVGTRYGSGCTSGHGVCGLSRLSPRSLVATAAFMGAGFATVFAVRHLLA